MRILEILFILFIGFCIGSTNNYCSNKAFESAILRIQLKQTQYVLEKRERSYKMGHCENLLLQDSIWNKPPKGTTKRE